MPFTVTPAGILRDGAPVRLRGASLGGWLLVESYMLGIPGVEQHMRESFAEILGPARAARFWQVFQDSHYAEADLAWLAAQGCNLVRLPFNHRLFHDDPRLGRSRARGFALLDRTMDWAARLGMHVLLDLHAAPGSQADDWNADGTSGEKRFWTDPRCQDEAVALWAELAQRYRAHPALFGYDPLCEPVWEDRGAINAFYRRVQAAIRAADPQGVITLEPNLWAREGATLDPALFDDPQTIVHGHWYPGDAELAAGLSAEELWARVGPSLDAGRTRRPSLLGEFGMHARWDAPSHYALITRLVRLLEEHGVQWCLWSLKDVGPIGLLAPAPDTPWRAFLDRPAIREPLAELQRLTGVTFGEHMQGGELQQRATALFPGEDADRLARLVREAQRHLEHLAVRHVARQLAALPEAELDRLAGGFAHAHCRPRQAMLDALRAGWR